MTPGGKDSWSRRCARSSRHTSSGTRSTTTWSPRNMVCGAKPKNPGEPLRCAVGRFTSMVHGSGSLSPFFHALARTIGAAETIDKADVRHAAARISGGGDASVVSRWRHGAFENKVCRTSHYGRAGIVDHHVGAARGGTIVARDVESKGEGLSARAARSHGHIPGIGCTGDGAIASEQPAKGNNENDIPHSTGACWRWLSALPQG